MYGSKLLDLSQMRNFLSTLFSPKLDAEDEEAHFQFSLCSFAGLHINCISFQFETSFVLFLFSFVFKELKGMPYFGSHHPEQVLANTTSTFVMCQ